MKVVDSAINVSIVSPKSMGSRRELPKERRAVTHKFDVGGYEGYATVGLYPDGTVGELFVTMNKEGSAISGLMDSFAIVVSTALQYGVPLEKLCDRLVDQRFEPSGHTGNEEIPHAKSIIDYLFRWLRIRFLAPSEQPFAQAEPEPVREIVADSAPPQERQNGST